MRDFFLDSWYVQPSLNQLTRGDEERQVGPKVMGLLVCLADRADQAVTKEELLEHVWGSAFTTEEALTTTVYELRKALDDDARCPRFVATVRGKGYRLIADIQWPPTIEPTSEPAPPSGSPVPTAEDRPVTTSRRQIRWMLIGIALATALIAVLFQRDEPPGSPPAFSPPQTSDVDSVAVETEDKSFATAPRAICSVVVLPIESLTPDKDSAIFAQGLSEQLAHDLAAVGTLAVVPGYSSVMNGRSSSELSTDAVIEGSVQPTADGRLWIRMQMVDTLDGRLLWGSTYDHRTSDSLDLQQELAREISRQILLYIEPIADCTGSAALPGPKQNENKQIETNF